MTDSLENKTPLAAAPVNSLLRAPVTGHNRNGKGAPATGTRRREILRAISEARYCSGGYRPHGSTDSSASASLPADSLPRFRTTQWITSGKNENCKLNCSRCKTG